MIDQTTKFIELFILTCYFLHTIIMCVSDWSSTWWTHTHCFAYHNLTLTDLYRTLSWLLLLCYYSLCSLKTLKKHTKSLLNRECRQLANEWFISRKSTLIKRNSLLFVEQLVMYTIRFIVINYDDIQVCMASAGAASGFFRTRITESPRRNIFGMNRSFATGFAFFLPLPVFGSSVHISLTFSSTILQCL